MNNVRPLTLFLAPLALVAGIAATGRASGADRPEPSVTFARSWEAAVEEARLLNVPIVIHSHGFY
jgi:hypothetical protein